MAVVVAHHRIEEQQPHQVAKDGIALLREGLCDGPLYKLEGEEVAREVGLLDALDVTSFTQMQSRALTTPTPRQDAPRPQE